MPIAVLPTDLVNKIAAGEVVERPSSIVKELVENSLDAGATRIEVVVEDGGRKMISVTDDGCGMGPDDLALAFAPHATSKITSADDLFAIATLGFRGEALASIAAVSHAHVRSRRAEDDSGHEASASGGEISQVRPCAAPVGTAVTVRDLFYNLPARRKFMRTPATEFGHVCEQIARLALPHPKVAFRLLHNGRQSQDLPAADSTLHRIVDLFGKDAGDSVLPIRARGGRVGIAGFAGRPSAARASANWQYFFLNGRYIRDRLLSHALREAYRGLADQQRWPAAVIFIEVEPAEVDVNVHPTKVEVRFRNSHEVHGALLAALRETLNQPGLAPAAELPPREQTPAPAESPGAPADSLPADDARQASLRQAIADFFKSAPSPQPRLSFPDRPQAHPAPAEAGGRFALSGPSAGRVQAAAEAMPAARMPPAPAKAIQVHDSYIVAAVEDGLIIVDQHALHERLLYNDLKQRLTSGALTSQRLLLPETVTVSAPEAAALESRRELLGRLGVEVEPFGPNTLAVQRFPTLLAERGVAAGGFVRELAGMLAENEAATGERLLEGLLETMACKAAVKAGDRLGPQEISDLLARREEADKASACPHGRPTTLRLTLKELERQFKRT